MQKIRNSDHSPNQQIAKLGRKAAFKADLRLSEPMPDVSHRCFGCAPNNRQGLRLRFQEGAGMGSVECLFRMPRRYEGPPGHLHGGIIAAILDEAMGKVNRLQGVVALTRRMSIEYLQPVPLGINLRVVSWPLHQEKRRYSHAAEIRTLEGVVLARSEGLFIAIDPAEMFRKHQHRMSVANQTPDKGTAKLRS